MRWVGILYRLHVNLYAVSAINRKSIIVLRHIGGHWQVKAETQYYATRILSFQKIELPKKIPTLNDESRDIYIKELSILTYRDYHTAISS